MQWTSQQWNGRGHKRPFLWAIATVAMIGCGSPQDAAPPEASSMLAGSAAPRAASNRPDMPGSRSGTEERETDPEAAETESTGDEQVVQAEPGATMEAAPGSDSRSAEIEQPSDEAEQPSTDGEHSSGEPEQPAEAEQPGTDDSSAAVSPDPEQAMPAGMEASAPATGQAPPADDLTALFPPLMPGDRTPSPDNPAECPDVAPADPLGDCLGLTVYLTCAYTTYNCICDWFHWICI